MNQLRGPLLIQPQRQAGPDIASALAWRDWETGLREARERRTPILALAEPPWTTSAQRLAHVLGQDADLRTVISEQVVPILVDPVRAPDLVARWRWASIALTGTAGPPLLLFLTHEGRPFLSYCTLSPEGDEEHPSLRSLVAATAETYQRDSEAFLAEARELEQRAMGQARPGHGSAGAFWQALAPEVDADDGGLLETPKHPRPQLLWLLLDLLERDTEREVASFLHETLVAMRKGGIYDQIDRGFHRCARDERWIVPHFEKPLPLNAQLAAVYARAARLLGKDEFHEVAADLASFCKAALKDGIDAIGADSNYYTWTPREVLDSVEPSVVQAIGLFFHVTQHRSRHVLYQAIEPEDIGRYSAEPVETFRRRVEEGRRQLAMARARRPPPLLIRPATPSWTAQSIRWLLLAAEQGCRVSVEDLEWQLERAESASRDWLEDRAAILAAMLACARVTGNDRWLERAREVGEEVLSRYRDDRGWRDRPIEQGGEEPSWAVTDDIVPSAIATVTEALTELGQRLNDERFVATAREAAAKHVPMAEMGRQWSSAFWRAWLQLSG